ncbi:MAG TPA: DUF433 domain-containing protein [Candidatus Kapabacteria bacterium]|jgi:uncharacterized protein (DUF433 family)
MSFQQIISDPEIMGGVPVFAGTRVPFDGLLDYLEAGETVDDFVRDFPTVTRMQATQALMEIGKSAEEIVYAHSHG